MAELKIQEGLWNDLLAVARRQRTEPEKLAERVLRDYVQRAADEELLSRSERAARRAPFRIGEAEEMVRRYRRGGA